MKQPPPPPARPFLSMLNAHMFQVVTLATIINQVAHTTALALPSPGQTE
jgi:hypothetical protein